jgi:pimeloyl-ACP methyl ester carboxylesterase
MQPESFNVRVPDEVLDDLQTRLRQTKWPQPLPYVGWSSGVDLDYMRELVDYWATSFDWRAQESRLNSFSQFTARVEGQLIHFVHERGRGPRPFPLVMTHGWPSSYVELLKLLPLLTDPARHGGDERDSFDVVVPSLPGFAFSGHPDRPGGCTSGSIADLWVRLMTEHLGYTRFGAQGQDIGAAVTISLGAEYADVVAGIHVPGVLAFPSADQPLSEEGSAFLARQERWRNAEGGYAHQQSTYPQTLALGLNDSPAGLAAWIVDKFRAWCDCDGVVERRFSKDELLTNVTIYWVTGSINSSFLFYFESQRDSARRPPKRVAVPVGVALFPKENPITGPRDWAEAAYNIVRWTEMPRGGHFPAAEEPELLASELREFFRPLR